MGRKFSPISYPCLFPPATIEGIAPPGTVTLLVPTSAELLVKEGQAVAVGEPLCEHAQEGMFASITGTVTRIMPWQYKRENAPVVAVTITKDNNGKTFRLFDSGIAPDTVPREALVERYAGLGYVIPDPGVPLLALLVDDDIDRVTNRWLFEKEFDVILTALKLLKKLFPDNELSIAVNRNTSHGKVQACTKVGRVITVKPAYPNATAAAIIAGDDKLRTLPHVTVIEGKRLRSMYTAITQGAAQTTMPLSYRYGKNGPMRLFSVTIGTTVGQFLQAIHAPVERSMQVIVGGEMTGFTVSSLAEPLYPGADALLVLPARDVATAENAACVNCGRCSHVCPAKIRVETIARAIEHDRKEDAVRLNIERCTVCGLCTPVCIVRRPLAHLMYSGKLRWLTPETFANGAGQ